MATVLPSAPLGTASTCAYPFASNTPPDTLDQVAFVLGTAFSSGSFEDCFEATCSRMGVQRGTRREDIAGLGQLRDKLHEARMQRMRQG